ncbi:peptidoglycan DD-metalloendopeptidase family protein [Vibrio harveyi]|uniref:peptidoglycan DD-metalloendopeptidase family protein n=1 Tax=Vibrio harveyi TaxID=669 RepID=UPI00237F9DEF|nr:peptidoglycan DD-metalloendopeptidase family protein [Vibrio harveyi]HDM8070617.1 peptidoglycan DD-metalloendopeptidase family protein [Vibrio harveyi]
MKFVRYSLIAVAATAFSLAAYLTYQAETKPEEITIKVTPYSELKSAQKNETQTNETPQNPEREVKKHDNIARIHYFVKVGDTLSTIFSSWGVSYDTTQKLLEADLTSLKLDTIKPGDHLELVVDRDTKTLKQVIFHESLVERAVYTQNDDGTFAYDFIEEPGEWREEMYSGTINGSFSSSAHKQGLTTTQIANITRVLRDKVNFARELRAGDSFHVLVNRQYLDDHFTGNAEVQGIAIKMRAKDVEAFLAEDGRFYDRAGNSLEQAFNRYPIDKQFRRITSPFNPYRKHPVTGRISPHNGTDFATPVGSPVYSTGDGKVIAVRNHPYAGKYLVIEHNSVYKTRYLHLSRFLVKKGDHVKRGQKIALSGATGRLTGPHLHFEVLVRNRAVDAMKADLPLASSISTKDRPAFLARVSEFDDLVAREQSASSAQTMQNKHPS